MKILNTKIRDYIVDRSQGSFKDTNNGYSRLLVKGIPFNIAESFINEIVDEGGLKINGRVIPIVLYDKKIDSSLIPENTIGGICGKDHILNLRNSILINEIIVLLADGSSLDKSNTTSLIPIGINEDISDDDWVSHDFIQYLLNQILSEKRFPYFKQEFSKTITEVLLNYRSKSAHQGDHFDQWELIKKFSEEVVQGSNLHLRATLGLIKESDDNYFETERSNKIFNRIAETFESNGVNSTIKEWCGSDHPDEIKNALKEFGNNFSQNCDSVSSFKTSPFFYYSRESILSKWWNILTIDVWNEILEETVEQKDSVKVEILNPVFKNKTPCSVVLDEAKIRFYYENEFVVGNSIDILSKKSKYELLDSINIKDSTKEIIWQNVPRTHRIPVNYKFQINGFKGTGIKIISLKTYEPGLVFDLAQLEKATVFKELTRKGSKNLVWNSSVVLSNSGTHEIKYVWDDSRFDFLEVNHKINSSDNQIIKLSPEVNNNTGTVTFDVEAECILELTLKSKTDQTNSVFKISVLVSESEPTGVSTINEKLILQNRSAKGILEKVRVYSTWNKLHQIQKWITDKKKVSHYPILLGSDFKKEFKQPNWEKSAAITSADLIVDCRPLKQYYSPPELLIELRNRIIEIIIDHDDTTDSDFQQPLIEYKELFKKETKSKLDQLIPQYLELYVKWFLDDTQNATWWDTIALCDITNSVLDSEPFAILLNPFHPIRLAWQYQSQSVLYDALIQNIPCPAAGVLDASKFPDSIALPCFKSEGQVSYESFFSVDTSNQYWSILWNSKKLSLLNNSKLVDLFDTDFGLLIHGLDGGLSGAQVEQTLSDVFKIKSGQNTINVEVHSESSETEMFNDGIKTWVENNLGEDRIVDNKREIRDLWFSSGSRKLSVYDTRTVKQQPTSEELVDMTIDSGFNLKWYSKEHPSKKDNLDLTILSHLSNQSPQPIVGETSSVLFNGGIARQRVKYSTKNTQGKLTFTESRTFSVKSNKKFKNSLEENLFEIVHRYENEVFIRNCGQLNSTPKLGFVYDKLLKSDYCAVSSSVVDPSAFFDSEGKNCLWDYELPSYSDKNASNSGFYLIARSSDSIVSAVRKSLKTIPGMGNVSLEKVQVVLKEISGRGIPTLKTLASGGASANGEIGMLTAMSLLQNFRDERIGFQLFPLNLKNTINILIPVDPFLSQLNTLQDSLKIDRLRPDLLALSFCYENNLISEIKITPIEVKYRTTPMDRKQMISALSQCTSFNKLYDKLIEYSKLSTIWDIARCRLFSDLISFSFSIYGRRLNDINEIRNWSKMQFRLLDALNDYEAVNVCERGRLIIISDYSLTEFDNIDSGAFNNVLKISFKDARDLLLNDNSDKFNKLNIHEANWGLISCSSNSEKANINLEQKENNHISSLSENSEETSETPIVDEEQTKELIIKFDKAVLEVQTKQGNDGIKFIIGNHEGALHSVPYLFHPSNTNLNQLNIGIIGDLGTGKTQLIKALVYNISNHPEHNRGESPKFLIMDTKRDYDGSGDKETDKKFPQSIQARVIKPNRLPINLFDIRNSSDDHPALSKAEFFIDILKKIFGGIGPNQEDAILTSVLAAFKAKDYEPYKGEYSNFVSPTLNDVFEQYKEQIGDKKDAPYSIMHKLVLANFFEDDPSKTIDFKDFFKTSVVLSLGGVASNDRNLKTLMIIFMNLYRDYMLGVRKYEFVHYNDFQLRKIDSYLLIDEANLIMEYELPVLEDLLLKGREFGVGIILSSQYLSHFRKSGTNYIEPLLTWFLHKVPNVSVKELQSLGLTNADEGTVQKIKTLEKHYCLYKGLNSPGVIIKGIPYYQLLSTQE